MTTETNRAPRLLPVARPERGVAILITTVILAMVVVTVSTAYFFQSRSRLASIHRQRAQLHARYCAEYAVARYGVPTFTRNSDAIDLGQDDDNMFDPSSRQEIFSNNFQSDDLARSFDYSFSELKMDKVYDRTSSKPFYFVSALGKVSWRDDGGDPQEITHRSAVALSFNDFSRFMYFSNGETSPEGNNVTFGANEDWYGRVHINGQAHISSFGRPVFHGLFSQTEETVDNLPEADYDAVFQGGYRIPYSAIQWPPRDAIDQMKEQRTADHTYDATAYDGMGVEHPICTVLQFNERRYTVAQYYSDAFTDTGDTIYVDQGGGQAWRTKNLPTYPGRELIYCKGTARLQGIVRGRVTVLASDTLFLTGDIVTSDVITAPCGNEETFGSVPANSPNRIGLASEGNIVIASTLANGLGNGEQNPGLLCGIPTDLYPPVITACQNGRKDIIINAALFAINCSFESEFWKTTCTTWPRPIQTPIHQQTQCSGRVNMHAEVIPCPGAPAESDRRGTIWLTGSVVQTVRGYVIRNGGNPYWANCWIGYASKVYRYDDNYLAGGPPVWFRVTYADGSQDVATEMVVPDYDRWRKSRRDYSIE